MSAMRPLSDREVAMVANHFEGCHALRNRCLFLLGVHTGFRISELLSMTLNDVIEGGRLKKYLTVTKRRMKGKRYGRSVYLNNAARKALSDRVREMQAEGSITADCLLFAGGRGQLSRVQGYRLMVSAFKACNLTGGLGTHTMRKTFAERVYQYFLKKQARGEHIDPFRATSKALGHLDIKSTDRYLSFNDDLIVQAIKAQH